MRVLKWAGYAVAGVAMFVLFAAAGAYAASEVMIRWPAKAPAVRLASFPQTGSVERGKHLADLGGCRDCHGEDLRGKLFHDEPMLVRAWAPNLTLKDVSGSDATLDAAIRHGVGHDGRRLYIMPCTAFAQLSDTETADLVAYLHSFAPGGAPTPRIAVGPIARVGLLVGKFQSEAQTLSHGVVPTPRAGDTHEQGRRLARFCVECHGADLKGGGMLGTPDLMVAAAYDRADFARLMRTGEGAGGRDLGLMSATSRSRFSHMSDEEIGALHDYLKARADRIIAAQDGRTATLPKS